MLVDLTHPQHIKRRAVVYYWRAHKPTHPHTCTTTQVAARSAASRSSSWLRNSAVTTRQCQGTMLNCGGAGREYGCGAAAGSGGAGSRAGPATLLARVLLVHSICLHVTSFVRPLTLLSSSTCDAVQEERAQVLQSQLKKARDGNQRQPGCTQQLCSLLINCLEPPVACIPGGCAATHLPGRLPTAPGRTAGMDSATPS